MRLCGLFVLLLIPQIMWGYSRVRNGGVGFYQNGQYLTFYSAKIQVRSTPLKIQEVPGLKLLLNKINQTPLNPHIKGSLLSLIYPIGSTRTYYQISDKGMSDEIRESLIKEYRKLTGEPPSDLVLFGMTNDKSETFLLPEFYQLNEIQQATILLHESLWNLKVEISYEQMVEMEMAAEAYFNEPYNLDIAFNFFDRLSRMLSLKSPVPEVLLQGSFYYTFLLHPPEAPQIEKIPLINVLTFDFLHCYQENIRAPQNLPDCSKRLQAQLMEKGSQQELSLFEKSLLSVLNESGFNVILCLKEKHRIEGPESLFGVGVFEWMKKSTIDTKEFWQESDTMPPAYEPYRAMNKFFKIYEGERYWGALGLCSVPSTK